jgi:hypothetical protein
VLSYALSIPAVAQLSTYSVALNSLFLSRGSIPASIPARSLLQLGVREGVPLFHQFRRVESLEIGEVTVSLGKREPLRPFGGVPFSQGIVIWKDVNATITGSRAREIDNNASACSGRR